jgi:2-hydroxycyclohexanecarboxyl-CoA dehydrogenase
VSFIQAVLPDPLEAGWRRIVNISSSSTHSGTPIKLRYVAAKSAVNGLTKSLALEYGPKGVTVDAVLPGFVNTPMLRNAQRRGDFGNHTLEGIAR